METLIRWGSALYNLVLVHMLHGNIYIFRTEEALEPDTSGRKINSGCNLTLLVKYLLSDECIID